MVKRGDIWLVNLDPTIGSEIKKSRPCVVISPPELNSQLRTVMVAPMTTKGFAAPFRVPITHRGQIKVGQALGCDINQNHVLGLVNFARIFCRLSQVILTPALQPKTKQKRSD